MSIRARWVERARFSAWNRLLRGASIASPDAMRTRAIRGIPNLWLVRHGQSAGNVARDAAEASGANVIELEGRDMDVQLSSLGEQQATALGAWFQTQTVKPSVVIASPFARAWGTAERIVRAMGGTCEIAMDERLREKEFGSLDRLTKAGILAKYPHEAEQRERIGKFYYRPPGGESWCDVVLRVRALLDHLSLVYAGERVLLVTHQVLVLCARYAIENLAEEAILAIDREGDVANCGLTAYVGSEQGVDLATYNFVAPLQEASTPVTHRPDVPGTRA